MWRNEDGVGKVHVRQHSWNLLWSYSNWPCLGLTGEGVCVSAAGCQFWDITLNFFIHHCFIGIISNHVIMCSYSSAPGCVKVRGGQASSQSGSTEEGGTWGRADALWERPDEDRGQTWRDTWWRITFDFISKWLLSVNLLSAGPDPVRLALHLNRTSGHSVYYCGSFCNIWAI